MASVSDTFTRRIGPWLAPVAAGIVFLLVALVLFGAGGNDDSHITYWSAWTLATRGEIVSYNGLPLEQSSSLTLVLVLGLLHALIGAPLPMLGWAVSVAAGVAVVAWLARRNAVAGLLAASALPLLYWSTSGMESSLAALLLLVVAALAERFLAAPSLRTRLPVFAALLAAAACRPEMPLLLLCTTGALAGLELASRSSRRREALELVAQAALASGLLVLLRLTVFGVPAPNPALMKAGGFAVASGSRYLGTTAAQLGWLLPAAAVAGAALLLVDFVRRRQPPKAVVLSAAVGAAGLAFCTLSGGDWMPAGRFAVPVIPFLALLGAFAIERLPAWPLRAVAACAAAASGLWASVQFAQTPDNAGRPHLRLDETKAVVEAVWGPLPFVPAEIANRAHLRDVALIPAVQKVVDDLVPTLDRPLVLASGQAGMVPYYVFQSHPGRLRFYDLFGLTDDALVRCLPQNAVNRSIFGAGPDEAWLLTHLEAFDRCGLPRPDVLFSVNISQRKREAFRKAGYELIYEQVGSLRSPHSLFPGGGNPNSYVAVRSDLRDRVGLPVSRVTFPLEDPGERFRRVRAAPDDRPGTIRPNVPQVPRIDRTVVR